MNYRGNVRVAGISGHKREHGKRARNERIDREQRDDEATSYTPQRKHVVASAYTSTDVPTSRNTVDAETVIAIASRGCVRRRRKHGIRHIASVNSAFIGGNARTCGRPDALRRTFLYACLYVCVRLFLCVRMCM